jgi:general secretion pathway protein N
MIDLRSSIGIIVLAVWCTVRGATQICAQPPEQPADTLANPLAAQSLDRLSATRDRPLFSPTRRPTPPPPPPPPELPPVAVVPQPPNLTLVGIVVDDEGARALIRSSATKADRVQIGDDIGGWKVAQIDGRKMVLSLDGRFATFTLFSNENSEQPPRDADTQAGNVAGQAPETNAPQTSAPQTNPPQPTEGAPPRPRRHHRK